MPRKFEYFTLPELARECGKLSLMVEKRSRRELLKMSVVVAGGLAESACYRDGVEPGALSSDASARYFPQSVASGDPRPNSVVLWTRVEDPFHEKDDVLIRLTLAKDEALTEVVSVKVMGAGLAADDAGGPQARLLTLAAYDHCALIRVENLEPDTTYYYRFTYDAPEGAARSRIGRTRTAPEPSADVPVKFAVISCQDYGGKYFHVHRHIAEQELHFVLHLGDYVYETIGDPSFQATDGERTITFSKPEEGLELGRGGGRFLAAQSLSNYRDLYKQYRSDPDLQALHERHPMIAIWDDHEFSDDSHGDVSTYSDGRSDEASPLRRAAADRAYSEYMPIDYDSAPAARLDSTAEFPGNFTLYRSFVFGRHLELVVTDLRRFRPDHLIPEDAPPGVVFLTQSELEALYGEVPDDAAPYVDIATFADGAYLEALVEGADQLEITADRVQGNVSAVWINDSLAMLDGSGLPPPIDLTDVTLERGYAYYNLLKSREFSRLGSRHVVAVRPFEALAAKLQRESNGKSELLMGRTQRAWFLDTMTSSIRTFKVWGSEIAFQSRHIDLTQYPVAPPELRRRITISAEDWDGFPNERRALLAELAELGNVVVLSGDLHCFFAGTPCLESDPEKRVVELTTSSVSSTTWLDGIRGALIQDGSLPMDVQQLVQSVGILLADTDARPNPHLAYQDLGRNGYSLISVSEEELAMSLYSISTADVQTPPAALERPLEDAFRIDRFRTRAGTADLERERNGEYQIWSMEEMAFR